MHNIYNKEIGKICLLVILLSMRAGIKLGGSMNHHTRNALQVGRKPVWTLIFGTFQDFSGEAVFSCTDWMVQFRDDVGWSSLELAVSESCVLTNATIQWLPF